MARISTAHQAGRRLDLRLVRHLVRRGIARAVGRDSAGITAPLDLYAQVPALFWAYVRLERATAGLHGLDRRLHALAELEAATLTRCAYCIDLGSAIARRWGLTDAELRALPDYASSPLFSPLDRLVLDYAVAMSRTPVEVPAGLVEELRARLGEPQLVQLTHHIALENLRGRFNRALGVGSAGLSDGTVCALPAGRAPSGASPTRRPPGDRPSDPIDAAAGGPR